MILQAKRPVGCIISVIANPLRRIGLRDLMHERVRVRSPRCGKSGFQRHRSANSVWAFVRSAAQVNLAYV